MNLKQIYHEYDCLNSPYQVGATCTPEELHSIIMEEIETIGASNPHWNKLNEIESDLRKRRYETMNVSKHTPISLPLPLQAIPFDDGWIRDADNHRVCMIDELEIREFIVWVCNYHEELVEALELLTTQADTMNNCHHSAVYLTSDDWEHLFRLCNIARGVLAKAKEE